MARTIPLDEVRLDAKSIIFLTLALAVLLGAWKGANYLVDRAQALTMKSTQRSTSNL